ncbi:hypothetical protein Cadr_000015181 [Camelus dromedarius]|uniref:Uncharacterized protein n=1 Tax=Camelus dromedarius TaxID=9838 RepID=A0A5N4DPH6_CAMDR|nr:hypothetical protein Cadr_000015181 [Camelus dromedarius]
MEVHLRPPVEWGGERVMGDRESGNCSAVIAAEAGKRWCCFRYRPLWGVSRYQANQPGGQETLEGFNSSSGYLDKGHIPIQHTLSAC